MRQCVHARLIRLLLVRTRSLGSTGFPTGGSIHGEGNRSVVLHALKLMLRRERTRAAMPAKKGCTALPRRTQSL